jgi:hypothetical protein
MRSFPSPPRLRCQCTFPVTGRAFLADLPCRESQEIFSIPHAHRHGYRHPAQDPRYYARGLLAGFKADHSSYRKAVLAYDGRVWHEVAFEYPKQSQGEITEFVSRTAKAVQNSEDQGCEASESSVSLDAVQRCPKRRSSHSSVLPLRHASWRRCQ